MLIDTDEIRVLVREELREQLQGVVRDAVRAALSPELRQAHADGAYRREMAAWSADFDRRLAQWREAVAVAKAALRRELRPHAASNTGIHSALSALDEMAPPSAFR